MRSLATLVCLLSAGVLAAQTAAEDYEVATEHPRLFLKPQRLRLLRRERERQSMRWQQLDLLVTKGARLPEPGFTFALYYQITGDQNVGRKAIDWALSAPPAEVRQIALVFDWCQPILTPTQSRQLLERLRTARSMPGTDVPALRAKFLVAIAVSGSADWAKELLSEAIDKSWRKLIAPGLASGDRTVSHRDFFPILEILHAVRDNLQIDLREDAPAFFRDLPTERILSYYPAPYPAPENQYRIPFYEGTAEPDLQVAALTRIAELSMVAYDTNATDSQFLQGWLLHDLFMLKSPLGAPYEFLWANPYQPGLTFQHMPLWFHDPRTGRLFIRSSWDDDAVWGMFSKGKPQFFRDGKIQAGAVVAGKPLQIGPFGVAAGPAPLRFQLHTDDPAQWFLVGLAASHRYDIEIEDEELIERDTDRSGILALPPTRNTELSIRIHEPGMLAAAPK